MADEAIEYTDDDLANLYPDDALLGLTEAAEITGYSVGKFTYPKTQKMMLERGATHDNRQWKIPVSLLKELGYFEGAARRKQEPLKRGRPSIAGVKRPTFSGSQSMGGESGGSGDLMDDEYLAELRSKLSGEPTLREQITALTIELAEEKALRSLAESRLADKEAELARFLKMAGME
jgi:hypothetical protein